MVYRIEKTTRTVIYLKKAILIRSGSTKNYPIRNIKCTGKEEKINSLREGMHVRLEGMLVLPELPRNPGQFNRRIYESGKKIDFYLENQPWYKSAFGYNNWKYYCCYLSMGSQRNEETDMPIFRIEEVMLNYAEAMCELGEFDQTVADATINKLRPRANVKPMKVSEINPAFDPKRDLGNTDYPNDYEVNPLLWEIRRERRIELFSEGFRFDDLRRWKKCHYALKKKLGQYVRSSDFAAGTNVTIDGGGSEGYLEFHPKQNHLWPDYYYLNPIPRNERVLNPQLEQNPGWENGN